MAEAMNDEMLSLFALAQRGDWDSVLSQFDKNPKLASQCSRFREASSGRTFLHEAARWGHDGVARVLISLGAALGALSNDRELPAAVAKKHEHLELARLLELAHETGQHLWEPSPDPDVLPSSSAWNESRALQSAREIRVAYGGGVIVIPQGATYYVDGFGRTLVGWHGTYDPPEGMC